MKLRKYHWIALGLVAAIVAYNYAPASNSLKKEKQVEPICIGNHCEPQVKPDCKNSVIKIKPCRSISENLWMWINSHGRAALESGYRAAGYKDELKSATIYCSSGIYNRKRIRGGRGRWSQHSYARACDGNLIEVNGVRFKYSGRGVRKPKTRDDRFFRAFLDDWGTVGPGVRVRSTLYFIDFNRGVRDCREDRRHCGHFHISKPCYACIFTGSMGYE